MNRSFMAFTLLFVGQTAAASPLTEEDAVSKALGNGAFNASLDAEHAAALGTAAGAGRWQNPQIQWGREQLTTSNADEDILVMTQQIDFSGRLGLESDAAEIDAKVVALRQRQVRAHRVARARQAFFAILFEQHRLGVLQRWRQQLADLAQAVRRRAEAGDAADYEARRLETQLARLDASMVVAGTKRESAWTDLVILMGQGSDVKMDWPRVQGVLSPGTAGQSQSSPEAITGRGDVAALGAERDAAIARERAATRWWVPRLNLQGGYKGVREGATENHGVVVGVGIELPLLDRGQGEDDTQAAIARGATAKMNSLTWASTQKLREGTLAVAELLGAVSAMNQGAAQSAEDLAGTAQQSYLAGELSVVELLDAHHNALETKLQVLALQLRARNAMIDVEREMGVVP